MICLRFVFLVSLSLVLVMGKPTIPEEMKEMVEMLHNSCVEETGVSNALIENCNNGDFADDNNLKCYIKCLMVQMAVMEDDGTIDPDAAIAILPEDLREKMTPVVHKCRKIVGSDPCDTALVVHKCFYEASPDDYLLI